MKIVPNTTQVNASGQGLIQVGHSLAGVVWVVYQLGFALNQSAPSPQIAAHVNGIPLAATVSMQPSVFGSLTPPFQPAYAMETFMVGPPYIYLQAGDTITCAVIGAIANDVFTVGAYIDENPSSQSQVY